MQNLKIRVNSDNASQVIDLLVSLGHKTIVSKEKLLREVSCGNNQIVNTGNGLFATVNFYDVKEITLPELRAMVNQEPDEPFLTPETTLNDQYAEIEEERQVEIHGTVKAQPDFNFGAAEAGGGVKPRENSHYFINVSDVDEVDFYEIAKRYNVADPAIQHILKKCLAIGNRGHKDLETDLKDILKTAKRALQINGFGE